MNILDIDLDKINKDREIGIKCKDFNLLLKCAVDMAEAFTYSILLAEEAAFFLGRIGDRTRFESVIYGPTLKLPPSLREPRSFQMEEKLYELGQKYPFLDDEELDFLETLYCKSNTFDMVNRMLFDGDDLLRRKLARFNQDDFNIRHDVFSCEFCLEIFDALIKNENELNVQEALDARHQSFDDMKEEARLYGFSPKLKYDPILVYNRRTNTIQVDETDLSDRFLCPISNFSWTGLKLGDAVNLLINEFNHSVEESIIVPALEKCRITKQAITYAAFNTYWYLIVENAIIRNLGISSSDERLLKVRERIAYDWLTYQNKKRITLMLRDTSILYELCLDLKEHRYINHDSEEILTESQNKRICQYLDDLVIDLFFRLAKFKPIVITPEICNKRFTDSGLKEINESIELNLNSPFDRYTFLKVLTTPSFIEDKFPGNKFAKLMLSAKRFSCYSHSVLIKPQIYNNPYIDPFYHKYRLIDFDNNRASSLFCFRDFLSKSQYDFGYDIHCPMYLAEILSDYAAIRKVEVFPNISLDYALSIYVILVEKIKLYEDSISSVLAFGLDKEFDISHPLQLFHNFELKLPLLFKTDCIDKRDLYLRFVNRETSKAFSFELNKPFECFTKIRLFNEEPITSVCSYNTLPLPYLYNKLYN